jgi:hypothetical protein
VIKEAESLCGNYADGTVGSPTLPRTHRQRPRAACPLCPCSSMSLLSSETPVYCFLSLEFLCFYPNPSIYVLLLFDSFGHLFTCNLPPVAELGPFPLAFSIPLMPGT